VRGDEVNNLADQLLIHSIPEYVEKDPPNPPLWAGCQRTKNFVTPLGIFTQFDLEKG